MPNRHHRVYLRSCPQINQLWPWLACYTTELMRSGGISDDHEDALSRPFPFTLVVNNPNESDS